MISEELEERIDQALGYPTHDPHGDPIPDANLRVAGAGAAVANTRFPRTSGRGPGDPEVRQRELRMQPTDGESGAGDLRRA